MKWKNTYHTIGTVKKSNRKITEAMTNNNLKIILENMDGMTKYCLLYKNRLLQSNLK
jgi:hypothetical protein